MFPVVVHIFQRLRLLLPGCLQDLAPELRGRMSCEWRSFQGGLNRSKVQQFHPDKLPGVGLGLRRGHAVRFLGSLGGHQPVPSCRRLAGQAETPVVPGQRHRLPGMA